MTVRELYVFLSEKISPALSCEWDNDGLMVCPDGERQVTRVLVALDATDEVISAAIRGQFDVIVTHHPLIFHPLSSLTAADPIGARVLRLVQNGIAVMSFHTRLDVVQDGVNDCLASLLGLSDRTPLCADGLGRVGTLPQARSLADFAAQFRAATGAPYVEAADAGRPVSRVAVLGGAGGDEIGAALAAGADTFVTGEVKYNVFAEAREAGLNLIVGGHYFTENAVCARLETLVRAILPDAALQRMDSCPCVVY